MDTGLGGLLAHGAVPGTTCFGFCELCDEHMLFPLPRPVLQRAPAGQAPPQPDRVSFPVPSVPMTLSCPSCSRPCTVDASVPAPLLDSSVSSSNSNPLLPDSTATGNAPTAPSGATGSWFDALLGPVPAGVTPNEAPSPASASTATGAGAGTRVGAGAMMSLIQAALFSQLTARTPNADDDDEDDEDLPEYERAARDTLSAAAAASGGGASSRGNGLGSLLELARAQEGLSLDDIMARLSSHEDLHPASPEFMSSLRTAARLPSRGDFYQLLLAVDGLPAAMPVAAAAFGRDPYAPLLSPVSTSAASSTAPVSTPELSTSSAAAEALLRKHKGGPSVETEVLASGLLQLAPDPTLASVSPAKPEQADAHPGALLALRGGISFARKAAAASRVGASCLLVCQTGAQWPYTMTDAAGEWPALAAAAGVKPTDPLLLMLRRDDAVKLAAHVAARATATAIASRITATAEGLEAALKGAYDALVAADASGARNSSGSLLAVPVEVVVLRRRRPLVCAVCQEDFVLPCERVEKAAEEENTEPVASCASESDGRDDVLTTLPCGHRFHLSCVLPWLRRQASCPLCRAEMPRKEVGKSRKARQGANADLEGYRHSMFT